MENYRRGKSLLFSTLLLSTMIFFQCSGLCSIGMAAETGVAVEKIPAAGQINDYALVVKLLKKQNHRLSRELGQIKREIAALRVAIHGVTPSKIFGGIGYILGLFGVGAMVSARKKDKELASNSSNCRENAEERG